LIKKTARFQSCFQRSIQARFTGNFTKSTKADAEENDLDLENRESNEAGEGNTMELIFWGTVSQMPLISRNVSSSSLRLENGEIWMFDAGEGTVRQILGSSLKLGRVTRIFVTHLHGDHLWGLPPLIATLNSAQHQNENFSKLHVYGPNGIRKFLHNALGVSSVRFTKEIYVHEIVSPNYNQNYTMKPQLGESDFRQKGKESVLIHEDSAMEVRAGLIEHTIPCYGYIIEEKSRGGNLNAAELRKFVPEGPVYKEIKKGIVKQLTLPDGSILELSKFLSPEPPRRKIVILGDTCNPSNLIPDATNADYLVHEATLAEDQRPEAEIRGHSSISMAAEFAKKINAENLVLTHFGRRLLAASNGIYLEQGIKEGKRIFDRNIILAEDFLRIIVPRKENKT